MVGELEILFADICVELLVILASEWELSAKQGEQEHREGPNIGRWTAIFNF